MPSRKNKAVGGIGELYRGSKVTPHIARVLKEEFYFGDHGTTWVGAPSAAEAKERREKLVKRLFRFKGDFSSEGLAETLANCRPRERCKSSACPECLRAMRRWMTTESVELLGREQ